MYDDQKVDRKENKHHKYESKCSLICSTLSLSSFTCCIRIFSHRRCYLIAFANFFSFVVHDSVKDSGKEQTEDEGNCKYRNCCNRL